MSRTHRKHLAPDKRAKQGGVRGDRRTLKSHKQLRRGDRQRLARERS